MKNFAPLLVALDKAEVTLDYRSVADKTINIFVGQMGSCKTFLLGHHQPFATLGTLDVRNSEDMVLPDKKGVKEIVYRKDDDLYEISHIYTPNKGGGHTIKSYIRKNKLELNENGNSSSFKQIIEAEFGLDQNFLKLFRIGSNVVNLPDMSASERKTFISSMLADTEIYTLLYKKISDENRAINAQMTILINKLQSISSKGEEDLKADKEAEQVIVEDLQKEVDAKSQDLYRLEGAITALRGGASETSYQAKYLNLQQQYHSLSADLEQRTMELASLKDYPDPEQVNRDIAQCHARISLRTTQMGNLSKEIAELDTKRQQIKDKLAILGSPEHIRNLKETYERLMETLNDYEKKLKRFKYEGSMGSITSLIIELQNLDSLIADVCQYDVDVLKAILRNSKGALYSAQREIDRAKKEKEKVQQEMTNITQVTSYKATHTMVRPFNCPTDDCPFYKYHPMTERVRQQHKNVDEVFLKHRSQINKLDALIYRYEVYPEVARKLETIESLWKGLYKKASDLGVTTEDDLTEIVTNIVHRHWYDAAKLQRIKELCGVREKYYELMQKVASMRNELTQYEVTGDAEALNRELNQLNGRYGRQCSSLEAMEQDNEKDKAKLQELNDAYLKISNKEKLEHDRDAMEKQCEGVHQDLSQMEQNLSQIGQYQSEITELKNAISQMKSDYIIHTKALEQTIRKLNDIAITKEQYEDTLKRQQIVHDILDAVSSKKGIPLAFVKLFLMDCKDVLNDLIADVFDDVIEIQDFYIPEDGSLFNIPYTRNGALIDDIIKSSQGERAVISLALSFSLIRQSTFPYNIMLLDEVDGPLDRNARNKFITILFKQLQAIRAEQVFIVSHNNTFDGFNVNIILTSDEVVDENPLTTVMKV
jgi:DNA repair exonuclease SbcCD ATPase subunit